MAVEETAAERRAKIESVSSAPVAYYEKDAPAPVPVGEEVTSRVLAKFAERESLERLESEGKYSRAKWKLALWIRSERSVHKLLTFTLSIWESGKRLHGGGDESTFICRRNPRAPKAKMPPFLALGKSTFKRPARPDGCDGVISGDLASGSMVACPHCGMRWDTEHIADSLFYRQSVEVAAETIARWFHELGDDCDISVKYRAEDIRVKMMATDYGLHTAQRLKGVVIYPLARIIRDTSLGASLESRIRDLLLS